MATANPPPHKNKSKKKEYSLVAAIDFGTTYSGFAFSFKDEFEETPSKVHTYKWERGLESQKTPTVILLQNDGEFVAFGTEAEDEYSQLANTDEHAQLRYFKHFKMCLFDRKKRLTRDTLLKDDQGNEFPAIKVFSKAIAYLKEKLLDYLKRWKTTIEAHKNVKAEEIRWVITVPAIWDEEAKQFMRTAAEEAGIGGRNLIIALEPEAAAVYCKEKSTKVKKNDKDQTMLAAYDVGTRFMVLDLGGGTVDVTVSEVMEDRTLNQIFCASGGSWGGIEVNKAFKEYIMQLVPDQNKSNLNDNTAEILDLDRNIEMRKRNLMGDEKQCVTLELGALHEHITKPGNVTIRRGKLKLPMDKVVEFFKPCIDNMQNHIRELLTDPESNMITDVIIVGGFAECKIMRDSVKVLLGNRSVTCPDDAGLAVLKGAVMYGHHPSIISARACNFTYGTEVSRFFLDGTDDPEKKIIQEGTPYCEHIFNKLAEKGQMCNINETVETQVFPIRSTMTEMRVHVFKSTEKDPKYVTDKGCTYMGNMIVPMPDTTGGLERMVNVSLTFGETELICKGVDSTTGGESEVRLDLLSNFK